MGASRDKVRAHRQQDRFGLCCADQAVQRATEAIPTSFANVPAHVRADVETATVLPKRSLEVLSDYGPAVGLRAHRDAATDQLLKS